MNKKDKHGKIHHMHSQILSKHKGRCNMFYEIVKELTRTKYNNSVFKYYGKNFADSIRQYERRTVKDRRLSSIKEIANKLDVPVDFVISVLRYEGIDEDDT